MLGTPRGARDFRELGIDYGASLSREPRAFCEKWGIEDREPVEVTMTNDYADPRTSKARRCRTSPGRPPTTRCSTPRHARLPRVRPLHQPPAGLATTSPRPDRYFTGDGSIYLYPGEMAEAPSAVEVAETGDLRRYTAWSTASDYHLLPFNAADEGQPYEGPDDRRLQRQQDPVAAVPQGDQGDGQVGLRHDRARRRGAGGDHLAVRHFKRGQQGYQDVGAIAGVGPAALRQGARPRVDDLIQHLRRQAI